MGENGEAGGESGEIEAVSLSKHQAWPNHSKLLLCIPTLSWDLVLMLLLGQR